MEHRNTMQGPYVSHEAENFANTARYGPYVSEAERYGVFEEEGVLEYVPGYGYVRQVPEYFMRQVPEYLGRTQEFIGGVPVVGKVSGWQIFGIPLFFVGIAGVAGYVFGKYKK